MPPITVMAVDDHPIVLDGLASLLQLDPALELIGTADCGLDAIELYRTLRPDVTLMDIQMRKLDGLAATTAIVREFPEARIILLSMSEGGHMMARAMGAGAFSYVLKRTVRHDLPEIVRAVHAGRRIFPPSAAADFFNQSRGGRLTDRELEVLGLVAEGHTNQRVADLLSISVNTVTSHMKNLTSKLDARDRTHAVVKAMKEGILSLLRPADGQKPRA